MRSTRVMCQSAQVKYQVLLDHLRILKESVMSAGEKQELIDILSNRIFEMENSKNDMKLVEASVRNTTVQRRLTE